MSAAVLQELRAKLGSLESRTRSSFPYSRLPNGMPRSALVELAGPGKTEAVAQFLAENPQLPAAWVEGRFSLFPSAMLQRRVNLEKIFFVEGGKESAWAATTLLRSRLFPVLVYSAPYGDERELRRFQLLAERAEATMILLAEGERCHAWQIHLSLEVRGPKLSIARRK